MRRFFEAGLPSACKKIVRWRSMSGCPSSLDCFLYYWILKFHLAKCREESVSSFSVLGLSFLTLETIKRPLFRDFIGPLKSLSLLLSLWLVQLIDKVVFVFSKRPLLFLCYQLFCNLCLPSLCLFSKLWVSDPMTQIWVWGFSFLWFG